MTDATFQRANAHKREPHHNFRILEAHELYRLDALYCTLDAGGRRRRFGAGVSDASIRSHCETLHEQEALVIGAFESNRMDAAIELWPFSSAWEQAEIAVVARRYASAPLKTLLRLAAEEAARRRCARLVALIDGDFDSLPLLASIGEVELDGEIARIDISIATAPFCERTSGYDVRADETFELR
jgi:hypothetical protein